MPASAKRLLTWKLAVHLHGCTDAKSCGSIINALVVLARVGKAVSNVWHFSVA